MSENLQRLLTDVVRIVSRHSVSKVLVVLVDNEVGEEVLTELVSIRDMLHYEIPLSCQSIVRLVPIL